MGTGKSRTGKELAQRTNRTFVDTDEEIVKLHGPISEIFAKKGEDEFRRVERELVKTLAPRRDLVIATGGGTLLDPDNVALFVNAEIIALTATPSEIVARVTADGIAHRPLLANTEDPEAEVEKLLEARADKYAKFTSVDTTKQSIDQVIAAIGSTGIDTSSPEIDDSKPKRDLTSILYAVITVLLLLALALVLLLVSF